MKIWRMSFRCGTGGHEMWPYCLKYGVAAITYFPIADIDLSKYMEKEPKKLWKRLSVTKKLSPSQKYSLWRVAREMKKDDIIYVKQGSTIVGKGIVQGPYQFDTENRIMCPEGGGVWRHQVPVNWLPDFLPIDIFLGDLQIYTVRELSKDDIRVIQDLEKLNILEHEVQNLKENIEKQDKILSPEALTEVIEGLKAYREVLFLSRNRGIIETKKSQSDYTCEVCGFNFEKSYGDIGHNYIVAHHIEPLGQRQDPSKTKLEDIALLCANCHAMIHTKNPPRSITELRNQLQH